METSPAKDIAPLVQKISYQETLLVSQAKMGIQEIMELANHFCKSGMFPAEISHPEKAFVVMMAGRDLGITYTAAMMTISVVKGRACLEAKMLLALCYRTREVEDCKINSQPDRCEVTIKRKGKSPYVATWTLDRAKQMGITEAWDKKTNKLTTKDNWKKQPANMLRWRAIAEACRFTFPDAISGCYVAEEIADEIELLEPENPGDDPGQRVVRHGKPEKVLDPGEARDMRQPRSEDLTDEQLGDWTPPAGKYAGAKLAEIITDKTPTGRLKGLEYLDDMAERALDPEAKDIISRYLIIARREGWVPEKSYDEKDIPNKAEAQKSRAVKPEAEPEASDGADDPAKA